MEKMGYNLIETLEEKRNIDARRYEKPTIEKQKEMTFPIDILEDATGQTILCRQCSSCHSCR